VIVFGGVFVGMVKGFRARTEQRWARESAANGVYLGLNDAGCEAWQLLPVNKNQMRQNAIRFCFVFITTLIDYALMLISMTFNVGLFFAVLNPDREIWVWIRACGLGLVCGGFVESVSGFRDVSFKVVVEVSRCGRVWALGSWSRVSSSWSG